MPIQFQCPQCAADVQVPDSAAGKSGRCPKCTAKIRIPTTEAPAASAGPSPAALVSKALRQKEASAQVAKPQRQAAPPAEPDAGAAPENFFAKFGNAASSVETPKSKPSPARCPAAPLEPSPFEERVPATEDTPLELDVAPAAGQGLYFEADDEDDVPISSAISQLRHKKPVSTWVYALPLIGIAIVGGAIFGYMKYTEPKFVGELAAERVSLKKPISVTVPWQETGATEEQQKAIRQVLDKKELPLTTNLMVVSFLSDVRGIIVETKNGYETEIVRVDPHKVPIISNWLTQNAERLPVPRSTTVGPASADFVNRVATAVQTQTPIQGMGEFRDRLALPALNRALGHWVEAVADSKLYPCLYEDPQGMLYFAVPANARVFEIKEKGERPGRMLPKTFRLTVSVPPRVVQDSPVSEPPAKPDAVLPSAAPATDEPMKPEGEEPAPEKGT